MRDLITCGSSGVEGVKCVGGFGVVRLAGTAFAFDCELLEMLVVFFFFQAEDGIRDRDVTGVQTCALPISGAPAAALDHLLVGEHSLVHRVPVDDAGLLVRDAFAEQPREEPLVPPVVIGPAGGQLALPVEREAEALQLGLHVRDVVVRPLRRRHAIRHRRVLGGKSERVPAHRLQHVVAAHPVVPGENVADGIVPHVPHVQLPRGVGEHRQAIKLRPGGVFPGAERALLLPVLLGRALYCLGIVGILHGTVAAKPPIIKGGQVKTACGGILAAALALAATQAPAAAAAMVEGVQMPAWVERGAQRIPLAPGMELKAGDQLNTGAGSRVVVKLSEGSVVKLGENGSLRIAELDPAREMFRAALNVLEGAFRFTTGILAKGQQREVNLRVATVTAGIRGTDLWGRARAKNEIVCLIEGQAEVGAEGEPAVTLNQPLRSAGYPAEIFPTMEGDKRAYVVRIRSLPSKAEAQALGERLRGRFGVDNPSVSG